MATNIQIFNNPEFGDVRTIIKEDGTLLFVASDVAKSLGYAVPQKAVIDHCKHCSKMEHPSNKGTYINLIPESDLYRLTMKSKLPRAEKFQDWVCEEVIPSIRKTGSYSVRRLSRECKVMEQKVGCEEKYFSRFIVVLEKLHIFATVTDGNCIYPVGQAVKLLMSYMGFFYAHTFRYWRLPIRRYWGSADIPGW